MNSLPLAHLALGKKVKDNKKKRTGQIRLLQRACVEFITAGINASKCTSEVSFF